MSTSQIQAEILRITARKTTVSKLTGSMKDYTRFKVKGREVITDEQEKQIKELFKKCYTGWWTVEVHNSLITE